MGMSNISQILLRDFPTVMIQQKLTSEEYKMRKKSFEGLPGLIFSR
jgi:hypothetical protein